MEVKDHILNICIGVAGIAVALFAVFSVLWTVVFIFDNLPVTPKEFVGIVLLLAMLGVLSWLVGAGIRENIKTLKMERELRE